MRIEYKAGTKTYLLEPKYEVNRNGHVGILGCSLYTPEGEFKGYWHALNMPLPLLRELRKACQAEFTLGKQADRLADRYSKRLRR